VVDRIVFSDCQGPIFAESGLESLDDFFMLSGREAAKKHSRRKVIRRRVIEFSLGSCPQEKHFFMKRFEHTYFKDMVFTVRKARRICSQAAYEFKNANYLLRKGVATYRPVCYGERMNCGLEKKSFLVTEKLPGRSLTEFVRQEWGHIHRDQKEKVIAELAKFVRRIHELNVSLPDLYFWHIFVNESQDQKNRQFAVIDLHRMVRNVTSREQKIKNLGRLDHSMIDKYFDEAIRQLFLESYAGNDWPGSVKSLAVKVKKYSKAVRRKMKTY
jgi:hypothetical protein